MPYLKFLGSALVTSDEGTTSALSSRRHPVALLALLATAPSHTSSRAKLVGLLWPEVPERTARNRLTSCVYEIRTALGGEALTSVGDGLRFDPEAIPCDVCRFEEALAAGDEGSAVELYEGPYLDGFHLGGSAAFDEWVERERDRLRRDYDRALETLARRAAERAEAGEAARWWRLRAEGDPYDTRVSVELMEALAAAGNRPEALRAARRHARLLEEELGTTPGPELEDLVSRLRSHAGERSADDRSIAVLPFETLGRSTPTPFTEGIHGDVLTRLSQVAELRVTSRTSVMSLRGTDDPLPAVARRLGVTWLLCGEVQEAGHRVQVSARLVHAGEDRQVWAERIRRELTAESLFEIQAQITREITAALQAKLTPGEEERAIERRPTTNLDAYRLYVEGRALVDRRDLESMRRAQERFERAIELDPGYSLAWVGLADALALLENYACGDSSYLEAEARRVSEDLHDRARQAIERALELDPGSAEAHASLGLIHSSGPRSQGPAAIRELERAVELRPSYADAHNWMSWVHLLLGHADRALECARRAVELNPLSPEAVSNLALSLLATGDAEGGLREARWASEIQPSFATTLFYEALALHQTGRHREAEAILQDLSVPWAGNGVRATLAVVRVGTGEHDGVREELRRLEDVGDPMNAGLVHAALGRREEALAAFERVDGWGYWPALALHHFFPEALGPLRGDPRFDRVLASVRRSWGVED